MKTFDKDIEWFINSYVEALRENNAATFIGSGMSIQQGFASWKTLLTPLAQQMGLDIKEEQDLTVLAQLYVDSNGGNRGVLNQLLLKNFKKKKQQTSQAHQILARLPISTYWTTNYDTLIEQAIEEVGKTPDVKRCTENLTVNLPQRDAIVYKMHGDVDLVHDTILTKNEYEDYNINRAPFSHLFKSDFLSKTFLFIGFGFRDSNLDFLIGQIRSTMHAHVHPSFYFMEKMVAGKEGSNDAFFAHQKRQNLQIEYMKKYGLYPVLLDSYNEIPDILKEIELRYKRSIIFISGSAADYSPWSRSQAEGFLYNLSYQLSAQNYKIVSGFARGVGLNIVNGALAYMQDHHIQQLMYNHLILLPFPVGQDAKYEGHRERLISLAGICIFLFGNKNDGEGIKESVGIRKEFFMSVSRGIKVIPVGATGYVTNELWKIMMEDFDSYYPQQPHLKPLFEKLGNTPAEVCGDYSSHDIPFQKKEINNELISTIIEIVQIINKER